MRVLVIGGTTEANALCDELRARGTEFLLSRAGALRDMPRTDHPVRVGGFGGAAGLAGFLCREDFTHLVLASHPYAERIAANAVQAAGCRGIPILRLERPPWEASEGVIWHQYDNMQEIAEALPHGSRTLLTIGRKGLEAFSLRTDIQFVWRVMEPTGYPLWGEEIVAGPSPSVEAEIGLMRSRRIDCLVAKNSGGCLGYPKIAAAEQLRVALHMLRRPPLPSCPTVATVRGAIDWLASRPASANSPKPA